MQLKREAKLLTVIGLNTKHADCRIIFVISNTLVTNDNFSELIEKIVGRADFSEVRQIFNV